MYQNKFHSVDLKDYSFLVTGGAGFIGSNIVEYLIKNNVGKLRVVDNLSTGSFENINQFKNFNNFEFIEGDLSDFELCEEIVKGIDFVSHQAALGSIPRSINNPLATNNSNVTAFVNMLTAAKNSNVKRFVYASSSSVYGNSSRLPRIEGEEGTPLSPYAVTKVINELYANVFFEIFGLKIVGLRYFNIYGPKQNPNGPYAALIPIFIESILENKQPTIFGDGNQSRDFTFVENAVQANVKAFFANEQANGKVFNIATGNEISVNQLFNQLKTFVGSNLSAKYCDARKGDVFQSQADISLAKKYLDYHPLIDVEEGLKMTINWFKNR